MIALGHSEAMKLYYDQRKDGRPNFGDALNLWLWPQLLPHWPEAPSSATHPNFAGATVFLGMGTLLNQGVEQRLAQAQQVIVFGSGVGYSQPMKRLPEHWQVFCVRGPKSARQLGVTPDLAITDGALLIRKTHLASLATQPDKKHAFAFMPHIDHVVYAEAQWQALCQQLGIFYIDPQWPIEQVLQAISQTQILLAEAMHGAIVADALRVPWVPIVTGPKILSLKWQDWCSSMGLAYRPQYLPILSAYPVYGRGLRSGLRSANHWGRVWQQSLDLRLSDRGIVKRLDKLMQTPRPYLSPEALMLRRLHQLETKLNQLPNIPPTPPLTLVS
jgi:succinoglycan biosynthesis protein ExoV